MAKIKIGKEQVRLMKAYVDLCKSKDAEWKCILLRDFVQYWIKEWFVEEKRWQYKLVDDLELIIDWVARKC